MPPGALPCSLNFLQSVPAPAALRTTCLHGQRSMLPELWFQCYHWLKAAFRYQLVKRPNTQR